MAMSYKGHKGGFTLLEVLIATGILAIGLVTIFTLFPIGLLSVKEKVDGTRATALARTARSELAGMRADLRITDSLSHDLASSYMQAGPWEMPADITAFRDGMYEYLQAGVVHRRIVFDDRRMVPISLMGTFAPSTITVSRGSLNRDADRLLYLYDGAGFGTWDLYAKVRGRTYRITGVTYTGRDLTTITVDDSGQSPALPPVLYQLPTTTQATPFQILFPVALKEVPVDVPQEWAGGYYDTTTNLIDGANRNLNQYLLPESWVSIESADSRLDNQWYQVAAVAGATMTLTVPMGTPLLTGTQRSFKLVLPVVRFSGIPAGDTENLAVISNGTLTGGGGPQLSMLADGAQIEIVLDGGYGDFMTVADPVTNPSQNPFGTAVTAVAANGATSGMIVPGNFIRIGGRDYEIATALAGNAFTLKSTVPNLGTVRYFQIVLGYDVAKPWAYAAPARFPVANVNSNSPADAAAHRYTSIDVGRDVNGYLPSDLGMGTGAIAANFANPVHVLPKNVSQFSYSVALAQRDPVGTFGVPVADAVTAPNTTLIGDTAESYMFPGASYTFAPLTDAVLGATGMTNIFGVYVLRGTATGDSHTSADLDSGNLSTQLHLMTPVAAAGNVPFHIVDRNDFIAETGVLDTELGLFTSGTYSALATTALTGLNADMERFIVPGVQVRVTDTASGTFVSAQITAVAYDPVTHHVISVTIDNGGGLTDGVSVTMRLLQTGENGPNRPKSVGMFTHGSSIVRALWNYPSDANGDKGFPYSDASPKRYNLAVGDLVHLYPSDVPDEWYAVKGINKHQTANDYDYLILDRAYEGPTTALPVALAIGTPGIFEYQTPVAEAYGAQTAAFRNYSVRSLFDTGTPPARANAAKFYNDISGGKPVGTVDLAAPLPRDVRAGDYVRADGDASHDAPGLPGADPGLGDAIDGDWQWYMIDTISSDRLRLTLTTPYRGRNDNATFEPASVSTSVRKTFDTTVGAF
jgi:prepilin-type N-terminal cleavage/methylation domain-containing protein